MIRSTLSKDDLPLPDAYDIHRHLLAVLKIPPEDHQYALEVMDSVYSVLKARGQMQSLLNIKLYIETSVRTRDSLVKSYTEIRKIGPHPLLSEPT